MNRMKKYVLPGRDPRTDINSAVIAAFVWVLITDIPGFFMEHSRWVQFIGAMDDFANIMRGALFGAVIYSAYRVLKAVYDMGYFRRVTKSIYVMKRLDEGAPVVKRTWTIALIGILAAFIAALIMFGIDLLYYKYCTPANLLPDTYHIDFWRALL